MQAYAERKHNDSFWKLQFFLMSVCSECVENKPSLQNSIMIRINWTHPHREMVENKRSGP